MTSRDFGGAFWEAEVDGVIDMGLRDPWPPDFAHCWLSEVDPKQTVELLTFELATLRGDVCLTRLLGCLLVNAIAACVVTHGQWS